MALSYRKPKYQSVITVLTAYKTVKAVSRSPLATPDILVQFYTAVLGPTL